MQNPDWIGAHTHWVPCLDLEVSGSSKKLLPERPSSPEPRQSGAMWVGQVAEILTARPLGPGNATRGKVKLLSRVRLFATTWAVAQQARWSMGFSSHEYWSGLPCPSPGDLPNPEI